MEASHKEKNYLDVPALLQYLRLAPGQWVGDFGVGANAHFVKEVAAAVGKNGGVVMFDVLKSALSGASTSAKLAGVSNVRMVWTNLEVYEGAHGVANDSLDAGLLINVLHQSSRPKDILAEVHRMLKPGAKLLVADWRPDVVLSIAPPTERRLDDHHVEQVAESVGFAPLKRFSAGSYHWGMVFAKA